MQHKPSQADHSINEVLLIPLQLIRSNRDFVTKAREAHLIDKAMTSEPRGIGRDKPNSDINLFSSLSFSVCYVLVLAYVDAHLLSVFIFLLEPPLKVCVANRNIGQILFTTLFSFSFFIFFYHSSCRKDHFTVLSL